MRITDLRRFPAGTAFECGICIVGSGPAGLTIASELRNTRHDVIVLESGGISGEDNFAKSLNEIVSVGAPRQMNQSQVRNRVLGGSSHSWFGRCAVLDPIDYERRDWVPYSGWPLTAEEMAPYVERSAAYLGVSPRLYGGVRPEGTSLLEPEEAGVRPVSWQFSCASPLNDYVRFGPRFAKLQAANIHVLTHATMTHIDTTADGSRVVGVEVAAPDGTRHSVRGALTVLCGGGIENARMLLASNRRDPRGVGNRHGVVGRFLMDHPRTTVGTFAADGAAAVQKDFGLFWSKGVRVQCGLSLSREVQEQQHLLNCAAWTTQHVAENDVWRLMRVARGRTGRTRLATLRKVVQNADQVATGLWGKFVLGRELARRLKQLDLDVMVEQIPDPESRIRLSDQRDALDVPLSEIDWRISDAERMSVICLAHALNAALERAGLPKANLVDWVRDRRPENAVFSDPAHPMGATRMASRPEDGVVDRDGKVFGVDNLYVAGSSVFPTGGHANPTVTVVALALRLADLLREQGTLAPAMKASGVPAAHSATHRFDPTAVEACPLGTREETASLRTVGLG